MLSQSNLGSYLWLPGLYRFCQPKDRLFAFYSVQFVITFLCCSCSFNCYGSLCFSRCLFVRSMIFLCFRLLPLLEHPLLPGYCLLDCCIPPPGLPFLHNLPPVVTSQCSLPFSFTVSENIVHSGCSKSPMLLMTSLA